MAIKAKRAMAEPAKVELAEKQISDYARTVKFTVVEYTFEHIVQKLNDDRGYGDRVTVTVHLT